MSCTGITDILARETGRYLPGEIFRRNFGTSPWTPGGLLERGVYPAGLSEVISNLVYGRSATTDVNASGWANISVVDGQEGGACLPPTEKINIGSTPRTFRLQRKALEGPDFCAEEFRSVFDLRKQLDQISAIIAERVRIEWEEYNRYQYFLNTQTKVVVNSCATPTEDTSLSSSYPAGCPTQTIGVGLLDKYRNKAIRNGAAASSILQNGTPTLAIIASPEWIENFIIANADTRQDIRWADSGKGNNSRLLQALGVNMTYRGYMLIADMFARRFTCPNGVLTTVSPFLDANMTKGMTDDINPDWETAPYEELFIFDPQVMKQLVPAPITNPAPNFRFDPVSYVGDIKVQNIPNRQCNPDGNILYHRVIMAASSEPMLTWKGYSFAQLRCDPACGNATSCSS